MSKRWSSGLLVVALALLVGCAPKPVAEPPVEPKPAEETPNKLPTMVAEARDLAVEALRDGEPQIARAALELALEEHPEQPLLLLNRGIASHVIGDFDAAQADFEAVRAQLPAQPVAHNYLGMLARERGDFAAAREHYETALSSDPQHALAHRNLGILCDLYLQQPDCALDHYQRYLAGGEDKQVSRWVKELSRRVARAEGNN